MFLPEMAKEKAERKLGQEECELCQHFNLHLHSPDDFADLQDLRSS